MPTRILITGVSTRAAAESAARAGFEVTAIDAFGDQDQHPAVRCLSLPRDFGASFSARAVVRASRTVEADAVAYLSNLDNYPRALAQLASGRALWGNAPAVLRRVRDPLAVADALRRRGCPTPAATKWGRECRLETTPDPFFLIKPLASGGGHGVRRWTPGSPVPRGSYLQEFIAGTPGSIVFVTAGGETVPLGLSRQLIGDAAFGATGYRYCGSILAAAGDPQFDDDAAIAERAGTLARVAAQAFGLVGVNGIDFIARDRVPQAIEINPRWSASMELVERAYGLSVFGAHAAACTTGALPAFDLAHARRDAGAVGKAVVFARGDVAIGDTRPWLEDSSVRDVPRPGDAVGAGQPVCTVFARAADGAACYAALVARAERVYAELAAWKRRIA